MVEPLLDVSGVAEYLNVSTRTIERIVAEGRLVPLWVRGQRRFTQEGVQAFLRSCPGGRVNRRRK